MREPFMKFVKNNLGDGFVLIACGLPGTWKTETTREVARIKRYPHLRSDIIRLDVLKNEDIFDEKVAANINKRNMVYDEMFSQAEEGLKVHPGVVLDATFIKQALRKRAAEVADKFQKTFIILETNCPEEIAIGRIERRTKEDYESNALTAEAYFNNKKSFEPVDIADFKKDYPALDILHLSVDTTDDSSDGWWVIGVEKS